jgi:hypothetical protein
MRNWGAGRLRGMPGCVLGSVMEAALAGEGGG